MERIANKRHTPMKCHLGNTCYAVTRDVQTFEDMLVQTYDDGSQRYLSDISLLFNQQRLDRMTNNALNEWFRSVARVDSQLDAIRKALPADAVGKFIKSRYIHLTSERYRYSLDLFLERYPDSLDLFLEQSANWFCLYFL